jgi:hypothetical protein
MRDYAGVPRKQLRTSNYSSADRVRLGKAVEAARLAAGYRYRTQFCRAHNIANLRGLELLEHGRTGVGQVLLFEVADALPGWDRETPRVILEGGAIPEPPESTDRVEAPPVAGPAALYAALEEVGWSPEEEEEFQMYKHMLGLGRLKLTLKRFIEMRNDFEEEEKRRRPTPDDGK